jgi:hypothetical protein
MSQYHPVAGCENKPPFNRKINQQEYELVRNAVEELGFVYVYMQDFEADDGFLPDFQKDQPFAGNK